MNTTVTREMSALKPKVKTVAPRKLTRKRKNSRGLSPIAKKRLFAEDDNEQPTALIDAEDDDGRRGEGESSKYRYVL
jgi:hypothetical protein